MPRMDERWPGMLEMMKLPVTGNNDIQAYKEVIELFPYNCREIHQAFNTCSSYFEVLLK